MIAQANSWASHVHVRHFWGINEEQDYDPQCDQMDKNALQSYIQSCRDDMGWKNINLEKFRRKNYGLNGSALRDNAGWICAQRRPGHGLGWLMEMYRDAKNIPDVLIITDDDTSVVRCILHFLVIDLFACVPAELGFHLIVTTFTALQNIEKLMLSMQQHSKFVEGRPFVGAGCSYNKNIGFDFAYGGYGTFLNRAAIHQLTLPIYCDDVPLQLDGNLFNKLSCSELQKNTIGELDVFRNGDSALDLFYKYSATRHFCLQSDWALGYMLTHYLHESLQQLEPRRCKRTACDVDSITCHNHGPAEMKSFAQAHLSLSSKLNNWQSRRLMRLPGVSNICIIQIRSVATLIAVEKLAQHISYRRIILLSHHHRLQS